MPDSAVTPALSQRPDYVAKLDDGDHRVRCPQCGRSDSDRTCSVKVEEAGRAGVAHCFRCGLRENWREPSARNGRAVARFVADDRERDARKQRDHDAAAERARTLYERARPATSHPYAGRKGITLPRTVRVLDAPPAGIAGLRGPVLVVPVKDAASGALVNVQMIDAAGNKRFLPGGRVKGACATVPAHERAAGDRRLYIVEGLATACSVRDAANASAVVAFSRAGLLPIAKAMRARFPDAEIIIAADNDAKPDGSNPGVEDAREAAIAIGAALAVPPGAGDFNDYATAFGIELARAALADARALERAASDTPAAPAPREQPRGVAMAHVEATSAAVVPAVATRIELQGTPYSHAALASALRVRMGERIRYVPEWGKWLVYDGTRWARDNAGIVATEIDKIAREQARAAEDDPALGTRPETRARVARAVDSATQRRGGEAIAASASALIVPASKLDVLPHLLNTPSGTLDLRTGELREHRPDDWLTKRTAVAPSSRGIEGSTFAQFLHEVTCGDAGLVAFLRRMLGACLFASHAIADHWLAFLIGTGRNGKGTLVEHCVARAMGDYARRIPSEVLLADDRGSRHPTEIANLQGVRLAYASEIDEGRRWNESRIKELTGGDMLSARFMRRDFFEFRPSHRLVIYANHRPLIENPDVALRSRVKLVPFNASFAGREDTTLPDRLAEELPIVLGWLVAGALDFYEAGALRNCEAVETATGDYFAANSTFDDWTAECCRVGADFEAPAADLYRKWAEWKERRGEGVQSQKRWSEFMRRAGFRPFKREGYSWWAGVGVRP